jgi:oligopeptide transport system permease protein
MLRYIAKRLLHTIPTLFVIATATFFMLRAAPGGPFDAEKNVTPEIKKALEAHYGMNKPLFQQYLDYLRQLAHGDLGPSFKYPNRTVNELIADCFPVSLELGCYGLAFALAVGLTAGIIAAIKPNTFSDYAPMSLSMAGICVPTFVLGPVLALTFGLGLHWFNTSGWDFPRDRVLPAVTLGFYYAAYIARLTRAGMIEALSHDCIRTARAKGASLPRILFRHALKPALQPVISFLGPAAAGIVTGSLVVETIFQIPGLARFFVTAAFNRDYTLVLGAVLFYATFVCAFNLIVDVVQVFMNPRLRFE